MFFNYLSSEEVNAESIMQGILSFNLTQNNVNFFYL